MINLDTIVPIGNTPAAIEGIDPGFLKDTLQKFQQKTWEVFLEIRKHLRVGMTEDEARKVALQIFSDLEVSKHWHRPYIRFGAGTALTFLDLIQPDYRLQLNDPVYIDLGPVWSDEDSSLMYEADVGDTFIFGENLLAAKCAEAARLIFTEVQSKWKSEKISGSEIYEWIQKRAEALGYKWVEKVDGHRIGDFPHQKYSKERLKSLQFSPSGFLWVLEVQINDPQDRFGAFYEDIL